MRRIPRKDANHSAIVKSLQATGALVYDTAGVGGGFPDLMVSFRGVIRLLEIKDGNKPKSARKLTKQEADFFLVWSEHVHIVNNETEALQSIGAI